LARNIYTYQPEPAGKTALGVKLPLNKGVVGGRNVQQNYSSGSSDGGGVFESSFDTVDQAMSNLKSLLLTRVGERLMQPALGTEIFNVLFENISQEVEDTLRISIENKIAYWLPYITVQDLVLFENVQQGSYLVQLSVIVNPQGANRVINILAGNENISIIDEPNLVTDRFGNITNTPVGGLTVAGTFTGGSVTGGTQLYGGAPSNPSFTY
jgi:phage baseplate assembly protein W